MKISVIVPTYNEQKHIKEGVKSLLTQDYPDFEIIVVDDGSTDKTREILAEFATRRQIIFLKQNHLGPGHARNLGANCAGGEILVFVDADMFFNVGFLRNLVKPIQDGKSKGTFSREEFVANWDKKLARFWQYNRGIFSDRMIPENYPSHAPIFRAILKSEFQKVQGYDAEIGYTDDWTLSRKLGYESDVAENAKYYHYNPDTLREVFWQARWIGKNEFIAGNLFRKIKSLLLYNFISSFVKGILIFIRVLEPNYLVFQFVYDFGICVSIMSSFFINKKIK